MIDLNVYLVERRDPVCFCEDYAMVVIAKDESHAVKRARKSSGDFKKAKLSLRKICCDEEQYVLVAARG